VERVLFPESCLAHCLSEEQCIREGSQEHGSFVGEEVSAGLQELVSGIDKAFNLDSQINKRENTQRGWSRFPEFQMSMVHSFSSVLSKFICPIRTILS